MSATPPSDRPGAPPTGATAAVLNSGDAGAADLRIPPTTPGMRIGLFGGSFNPPHAGHVHVAETALARLGLDRVWMMVTPGNPLKDRGALAPLGRRIAAARTLTHNPRVVVTAFEASLGATYSWQTVARLVRAHPQVRFVWVMGADNLASFHRWQHWRRIASAMPIAIVDRPGSTLAALSCRAGRALDRYRLAEADARSLADHAAPAWVFVHAPRVPISSSALRADGHRL